MENVYDCHTGSWKQLFDVTKKLVKDEKEIQGISVINWQQSSWKKTTLLTDWAVQLSTAKNLRILRVSIVHGQNQWKSRERMEGETQNRELDRIDREPMEFEWKISKDSVNCRFSPRSRTWWLKDSVNLSNSQEESSSCQCTTTLVWGE